MRVGGGSFSGTGETTFSKSLIIKPGGQKKQSGTVNPKEPDDMAVTAPTLLSEVTDRKFSNKAPLDIRTPQPKRAPKLLANIFSTKRRQIPFDSQPYKPIPQMRHLMSF